MKLYHDGIEDTAITTTNAGKTVTVDNYEIGRNEKSNSNLTDGRIGDVMLWDRALSPGEIYKISRRTWQPIRPRSTTVASVAEEVATGRIMSSLIQRGGLVNIGGLVGQGGGLVG
jgi:hypothetical protein